MCSYVRTKVDWRYSYDIQIKDHFLGPSAQSVNLHLAYHHNVLFKELIHLNIVLLIRIFLLHLSRKRNQQAGSYRVTGLFVPLHFRSRERKDHRENFRSRGTFVPWNIRSRGAKSPRTFAPWNFRSCGTFAPQERMFQELSFRGTIAPVERSLHKQLSCPYFHSCGTFAAVLKKQESNVSIDVCWQTFAAVCL